MSEKDPEKEKTNNIPTKKTHGYQKETEEDEINDSADKDTSVASSPSDESNTSNLFEIKGTCRKEWKFVRLVPKKEKAGLPNIAIAN